MLGKQLARLQDRVPDEQMLLILFDDFVSDTKKTYEDVAAFLGLAHDHEKQFDRINDAKQHRYRGLSLIMRKYHRKIYQEHRLLYQTVKRSINAIGMRPLHWNRKLNRKPLRRPALSAERHAQLISTFAADVARLEAMLGRSLDCWRTGGSESSAPPIRPPGPPGDH